MRVIKITILANVIIITATSNALFSNRLILATWQPQLYIAFHIIVVIDYLTFIMSTCLNVYLHCKCLIHCIIHCIWMISVRVI